MTKVFISYSHDSDDHRQFVRELSDQLRGGGLDCQIDQYVNGFPPEGWLRWMQSQIKAADFVLLMCTPTYLRRYEGEDHDGGRGVNFEGVVISQTLYDNFYRNTKFIALLPERGSLEHVPLPLKAFTAYTLPRDYQQLYRFLTGQPAIVPPPLGDRQILPPENHNPNPTTKIHSDRLPTVKGQFFGRQTELDLLDAAWAGNGTRVIQFIAAGGTGKTKLLRHWLDQHSDEIPVLIAWSFYSQGASEDKQVSATPFFSHALEKLGSARQVSDFANQAEAMGEHLAELLRRQRSVLVLDGLEPLQHAGRGMRGELKDRALRQLLKSSLNNDNGLCLITTRIAVHELSDRAHAVAHDLHNLAPADGVKLLQSLGVKGNAHELEKAVTDYGCHALALSLLGNLLRQRYHGDLQRRDCLPALVNSGGNRESQHAFKVMQAYQDWFGNEPQLAAEAALLHLLGLFDHPIDLAVLQQLWDAQIPGLTADIAQPDWLDAISSLREEHHLLSAREAEDDLLNPTLDCHPLLREYFGAQLQQTQPQAWQLAHACLYDYYKALPEKELPDTLAEMQPLFSAVAHGCAAGWHQQAFDEVYWPRVQRQDEYYLFNKLGAFSDDLATVAHFFTTPWQTPAAGLTEHDQATMLSIAGFDLRGLGRLREALEPMQASMTMRVKQENWKDAAINANNLSQLQLTLGDLPAAIASGLRSVDYAEQSGDLFMRMGSRTTLAEARQQAGETAPALALFQAAEQLQQQDQPEYPRLYSLPGYRYCDWLLAQGDTAQVLERAEYALEIAQRNNWLLDIALDQLSLGRAYLQQQNYLSAGHWLQKAVAALRAAGTQDHLPRGLLARAALHRQSGDFARARLDLQEVFDIAQPSGMRLHLTDYHLESARLLLAEAAATQPAPDAARHEQIQHHLTQATQLIQTTGYRRRQADLEALQQLAGKSSL